MTPRVAIVLTLIAGLGCAPSPVPTAPPAAVELPEQTTPVVPTPPIAATTSDPLKTRIETAIDLARSRDLLTTNAFWTVFHGVLAFGPGLALRTPDAEEYVPALDYILSGRNDLGRIRGLGFIPTESGLDVQMGPTFIGQGHQDQFVAICAQWDLAPDQPVIVHGKAYTIMDFVREIQAHARLGQELSWSIIAISHYVGTDASWTNRAGEKLTFDDLVRSELDATIDKAACGGTHRLYGLTLALNEHRRRGGKMTPLWKEVDAKVREHIALARQYQGADGNFSTNYFRGPGTTADAKDRMNSSGHTLEWLSIALTDEQLQEPWMQDAAGAMALMFLEYQSQPMESGALYHALHGLTIYYDRVYGFERFKSAVPASK
ncbi:hypothetical protein Pan216_22440 [Planctomycetes bacterium Pan216]|uniref:ADP-ribosylation factor-directed GTPase activating protein n=1 Tax=Kolteria novifilia TaxID=2527975 RepID=A0A518B329_9BACT|nr:hypothetical protein Pan216_22440 [Planctomycetes bacterium Pan216]